ncbi:hypothetical protein [Rhodococcus sp. WMMA185]|uniref:hypothetical protein n=1 Tax=Rhodococcus sp. WMMA185 TaxID=679318 RepID=UPI000AE6E860|nr:hypothetical protein [Rhodococcus sp. WMMA185]
MSRACSSARRACGRRGRRKSGFTCSTSTFGGISGRTRDQLAESCGATIVITAEEAERHLGKFDAVLEAAGASGAASLATRLAHTVFGAPSRAWIHAVSAFTSGVLDPKLIISRDLELSEAADALRILEEGPRSTVKILLHP